MDSLKQKSGLRILIAASEMVPFVKTGGLADVTAALALHLRQRGHDARVVLPFYQAIRMQVLDFRPVLPSMCVRMGTGEEWCSVLETATAQGVPVYCIEHHGYFDRAGLYHDAGMNDYADNPRRYGFFSRACLQLCMDGDFSPDVVHVHDWQTAPIPAYMKGWFWNHSSLGRAASVLTIHNIAYQGVYPQAHYGYLGLGAENFTAERFESHDHVNFLKGGLYFADMVNTVSPTFARECVAAHGGFGLAPHLARRGDSFTGILNGVDYGLWNPEEDPLIPARYSAGDLAGKAHCKRALQRAFGLEENPSIPILGAIGRFVGQKGFHLLRDCIERLLQNMRIQFVILGCGEYNLSNFFGNLPGRQRGRAGSYIGHNESLAHLIEAGSDFFAMPSLFEPCGLNQLYSLRYGTLPIVRATGGLDDTVEQYDEATGAGTGFKFWEPTPQALHDTIGWAVSTYYDRPEHLHGMIRRAMLRVFSWDRAVLDYEDLYIQALVRKQEYDASHRLP